MISREKVLKEIESGKYIDLSKKKYSNFIDDKEVVLEAIKKD